MKNQYRGGDCLKRDEQFVDLRGEGGEGKLGEKEGVVFLSGGVDTPMPTMIILSHLELSRIDLSILNSSILMEIVKL